jgi:hypothetical protein
MLVKSMYAYTVRGFAIGCGLRQPATARSPADMFLIFLNFLAIYWIPPIVLLTRNPSGFRVTNGEWLPFDKNRWELFGAKNKEICSHFFFILCLKVQNQFLMEKTHPSVSECVYWVSSGSVDL